MGPINPKLCKMIPNYHEKFSVIKLSDLLIPWSHDIIDIYKLFLIDLHETFKYQIWKDCV